MESATKEEWNSLWISSKGGVYQNWFFNEYYGKTKKPIKLVIRKENSPIAGIICYEKTIKTPLGKKIILEAHGNPIYKSESDLIEILREFKRISKNYFYGTIAPTILSDESKFVQEGYKKSSNHTITLNLSKSERELWSYLEKKSIRWGINSAKKNNLSFSISNKEDISNFIKIYKKTAEDGNFTPEDGDFIKNLANTELSKLFLIRSKDKIIAGGLILLDFNKHTATLSLTASTPQGLKLQAMPFLYWNLILYAKSQGFKIFDLGGYDSEARGGEKTSNINKFKERFGGEIREQAVFSTNSLYPVIRSLMKHLRFIKKLYKKSS